MYAHINPPLQAYLLAVFVLVLAWVAWYPQGTYTTSLMVAGAVLAYVLVATLAQAGKVACHLVSVEAADTLTLLHKGRKVRVKVYGLQAPDPKHPAFEASRQALEGFLQGQELAFRPAQTGQRVGRIRRDERMTVFASGDDVALLMLAGGHAALQGDGDTLPLAYLRAHGEAMDAAIGLHANLTTTVMTEKHV